MNRTVIPSTHNTPEVIFDPILKKISIKGICTPENPRDYFRQIFKLMDDYLASTKELTFELQLNYYNSGSTKCLLHLFMKIAVDPAIKAGAVINWIIDDDDDELRESGQIFEEITNLKFNYITES
jgi:hypothetical protein